MAMGMAMQTATAMLTMRRFGASIPATARFFSKFSAAELVQFDTTITDIHKFEKIRYPDGLSEQGGLLFIEWDKDSPQDSLEPWFPTYKINAIQIDYLVLKIFEVSSSNLSLCMSTLKYNPHVREILTRYNPVGTQILGD